MRGLLGQSSDSKDHRGEAEIRLELPVAVAGQEK